MPSCIWSRLRRKCPSVRIIGTVMRNYKNNSPKNGTKEHESKADRAVDQFTKMMISRMEAIRASNWKQGWTGSNGSIMGLPQNLSGRNYSGTNSFFLQMDTAMNGYKAPVYMTYLQVMKEGAHVLKGQTSMPVIYWDLSIKDRNGHRVDLNDFRNMSLSRQQEMEVHPFLKAYNVFNITQTSLEEVNKKKYDQVLALFQAPELRDSKGMYENKAMDRMSDRQEWLCPIQTDRLEDGAYYSPREDKVVVPMKAQFNISDTPEGIYKDGMEYYSTVLHEMAHSTGTPERLNRTAGRKFGDVRYAREELVAELSAALVGNAMGFDKRILNNNAAYLDGWISALREDPKFIISVMADVNKAGRMMMEKVDAQKIALGETPLLDKDRRTEKTKTLSEGDDTKVARSLPTGKGDPLEIPDGSVIKRRDGTYAIRGYYRGTNLGVRPLDTGTAERYLSMPKGRQKETALKSILSGNYTKETGQQENVQNKGMKL